MTGFIKAMILVNTCVRLMCLLCDYKISVALFCLPIENGYIQKAVNYDGEMFIIEEIQLYENPEAISILRLSSSKVTHKFRYSCNMVC